MAKKAKVLLVDDSVPVLNQERSLLERTGVTISTASTGTEAIKKIYRDRPDVVFLDLMLPEMSGDAVCRFIKNDSRVANTAIVIVTGKDDELTMQRCFQSGCDAFVSKPFKAEEILKKLKVVLDDKEIYLDWDRLIEG
jgi:two-component system alkaline phosphatase synthesis response regulator PhoP